MKKNALVIFDKNISATEIKRLQKHHPFEVVISPLELEKETSGLGISWRTLESLVEAGSIYEATELVEELSQLTLPNGTRLSKSCVYEGYELWWIHYTDLFLYFCIPYTQYKKLLVFLKDFQRVTLYETPIKGLFMHYLESSVGNILYLRKPGIRTPVWLPFGVFVQVVLTLIYLPIIVFQRRSILVFTGDKFDGINDFDFRMKFIYSELRERNLAFLEIIRSLESWKTVLSHAITRKRAVIYSVAVATIAHYMSSITGGKRRSLRRFDFKQLNEVTDSELQFKLKIASWYIRNNDDDAWGIRIMKYLLPTVGVKTAFIPAATDRNFHTVLGCKLNTIPTVGILHGVASRHYNMSDFMRMYDGEKILSVDKYGLWSHWWLEYYKNNSRAYRKEQLHVSGLMRPRIKEGSSVISNRSLMGRAKVLFVSEQLAVPEEALPYLQALMDSQDVEVYMKFRPYRDGFELWLRKYHPTIFERIPEKNIFRSDMKTAVSQCDIVVGSHSTAVLEALFELKPIVFYATNKWGDYFSLRGYSLEHTLYAESPEQFVKCIKENRKISSESLQDLQKRFFGDLYQNGSQWVINQLEMALSKQH